MKRLLRHVFVALVATMVWSCAGRENIALQYPDDASNRVKFAAEHLTGVLEGKGYRVIDVSEAAEGDKIIRLSEATDSVGPKEGFTISSADNIIDVKGNDGSGVIYGCRELADRLEMDGNLDNLPAEFTDAPKWCFAVLVSVCRNLTCFPGAVSTNIPIPGEFSVVL